jgi:hypothetical protein
MRSPFLFVLAVGVLIAQAAAAGDNANGVLLLHADPSIVYSSGVNYCGLSPVPACSSVVTQVDLPRQTPLLVYALAAIPDSSQVRLKGITFGITYDPAKLDIIAHGKCADGMEIADPSWPDPGTGTSLTWSLTEMSHIADVYWFAVTAIGESPSSLSVTAHPTQGGNFADDSVPSQIEPIAEYGSLGFGQAGYLPPCSSTQGFGDYSFPPSEDEPPPLVLGNADETITIAEGNEFSIKVGDYERTYRPGDVLHFVVINGTAFADGVQFTPLPTQPRHLSDIHKLRQRYGASPLVQAYVQSRPEEDSVLVWNDAVRLLGESHTALIRRIDYRYARRIHSGVTAMAAAESAAADARASDLVRSAQANGKPTEIDITWIEESESEFVMLSSRIQRRPHNPLPGGILARDIPAEIRGFRRLEEPGRRMRIRWHDGICSRSSGKPF